MSAGMSLSNHICDECYPKARNYHMNEDDLDKQIGFSRKVKVIACVQPLFLRIIKIIGQLYLLNNLQVSLRTDTTMINIMQVSEA